MSKSCVDFSKLSDLYDDELPTHEEREHTLQHLDDCPQCNIEYGRLKRTVRLVACLRYQDFNLCEFSDKTIRIVKTIKWKRRVLRYLPAAAAVLVVAGGSYMATSYFSGPMGTTLSRDAGRKSSILTADGKSEISSQERIVNIVSDMKAKVHKVADSYVEGEISYDRFKTLYRKLGHSGFYKIKFMVVSGSNQSFRALDPGSQHFKSNFEEVSSGNSNLSGENGRKSGRERSIRFRIYP